MFYVTAWIEYFSRGGCEGESNDKMNVLKIGVCTERQLIYSIKMSVCNKSYQIYDIIKMRFRIENQKINYIKSVFGSKITKLII